MIACLPPASLSIRKADANYCPMWHVVGPTFRVLLDGVHQTRVIAYDGPEGWVRRLKTDAAGKPVLNEARDEVAEETLRGVVTVEWGPDGR